MEEKQTSDFDVSQNETEPAETQVDSEVAPAQATENSESEQQTPTSNESANDGGDKKNKKLSTIVNRTLSVIIIVLVILLVLKIFVVGSIAVSGGSMEPTYLPQGDSVTVNKLATPKRGDIVVAFKYDVDNKLLAYFAPQSQCQPGKKYFKIIKRAVAVEGDKIWTEKTASNQYVFALNFDGETYYEFYYWDEPQTKPYAERDRGHYVLAKSLDEAKAKYGQTVVQLTMTPQSNEWLTDYDSLENCYVVPKDSFLAFGDNREISQDSRSSDLKAVPNSRVVGVVI